MSSELRPALWFAFLAPPAAWFAALTAAYFLVNWACGSFTGRVLLHAVLLAMLALSATAAGAGVRTWRRAGREWPGESSEPVVRTRFLAVLASMGGVIFSVAILWFWIASLVLRPCEPGPRLRFAPSASAPAAEAPAVDPTAKETAWNGFRRAGARS